MYSTSENAVTLSFLKEIIYKVIFFKLFDLFLIKSQTFEQVTLLNIPTINPLLKVKISMMFCRVFLSIEDFLQEKLKRKPKIFVFFK